MTCLIGNITLHNNTSEYASVRIGKFAKILVNTLTYKPQNFLVKDNVILSTQL